MGQFKTVVVTGGEGFIGRHLVKDLLNQGAKVISLDNGVTSDLSLAQNSQSFKFIKFDVCHPWSDWIELVPTDWMDCVSHVFHLASPASPKWYQSLTLETLKVNSEGTERALKFAQAYGARMVLASSSEIYGFSPNVPFQEDDWGIVNPRGMRSCYVESKRFAESLVDHFNRRHGSRHGVVRIFNTYGPGMCAEDGRVIINFLSQALLDKPLTIYGDGLQTRSFCYVDDLISGLMAYAARDIEEPVNLGNDTECSVRDLVKVIEKILGRSFNKVYKHRPENDPLRRRPDISKAKRLLTPWAPATDLEQGLRATLAWLQEGQKSLGQTGSQLSVLRYSSHLL